MKPTRAPIKPKSGENWDQFFQYARKNRQWQKYLRDSALQCVKKNVKNERE